MVKLFHRDLGGAGKPPLVILHGLLGSSRNWQAAGADLAGQNHVFALDLRNHGRSPHDAEMSYAAMAADVLAWLEEQRLAQVDLLGHSLGGKVAMLLACRHPLRVRRLIVVEISPRAYTTAAHAAEFSAMNELDLASLQSRGEAEEKFAARVPDWAMRKFISTNLERTEGGSWRWQINLPALTTALSELAKNPLALEDHYEGPALFVVGGKSDYVRSGDDAVIHRHFPNARIETIAEAGHNPHMETRAAFVRLARS